MPRRPLARAALLLATALAACDRAAPLPREFDGAAALRTVETQLAFGPRIPGTDGQRRMAAWLDSLGRALADTVLTQDWENVTAKGTKFPLHNVLWRFNPGARDRILYLAHWDTRPISDGEKAMPADRGKPVPGANDGGSGVAILVGVAEALRRKPSPVGVDLLFVDGEDWGSFTDSTESLLGSRYYARHQAPGPTPLYAVLWDMVGDRDLRIYEEGNSSLGAPEVVQLVWDAARAAGHGDVFVAEPKYTLTDDHVPLQQVGIRAIDVIDFDFPWHHTPDDTLDKVSAQSLQAVGDVAVAVIRRQEK